MSREAAQLYERLPYQVQALLRADFERLYRQDFETSLAGDLLDGFLDQPDIKRQYETYIEDCWQEQLRDCDDYWTGYLESKLEKDWECEPPT